MQGSWIVTRSLRGAAVLVPGAVLAAVDGSGPVWPVFSPSSGRGVAAALQLALLAAAEHRATFVDFLSAAVVAFAAAMAAAAGGWLFLGFVRVDRRRGPGFAIALLRALRSVRLVAAQMGGQRLAALLAGAEHVGRQLHVRLLRRRLVGRPVWPIGLAGVGHRRELDGRAGPLAPDGPSPFLRSADFASAPTTGTLPVAVPGPTYFSRPMAPASGPGGGRIDRDGRFDGRRRCGQRAVSDGDGSVGRFGRLRPGRGAAGFGVTITGILPVRAGSVGRCGAGAAAVGRLSACRCRL